MRPALPVAVEPGTQSFLVDEQGNKYEMPDMVFTEYDAGRFRAGYCCIHCLEAQETPFPEKCRVCAFPMREQQAQRFSDEFGGYTTVGPSKSLAELRAEDEEAKARARYAREKPTSSIWLPSK